ncbi:prenyltransferase [Halanaerobiaceae bacterium Z-7014]|uniref:Prenyltransferase n=1 Tax=Halonatronomonas betaini TaxID=2778430 RepID=A0A931AUI7_9FIRM|nr:prenyltransferase [Halonatronomonas betaini]MBF8437040.1 prenyltransferase [Halonatronomonas betaini]
MEKQGSIKDWIELLRLFSWPCIFLPAILGGSFAYSHGVFNASIFFLLLVGILMIHIGITIVNEYYDVKNNIDTLEQEKPSKVLVEERIAPDFALKVSKIFMLAGGLGGSIFIIITGHWPLFILLAIGLSGGYFYTAPPISLKYIGLGVPANFIILGLLIPQTIYYGMAGEFYLPGIGLSLPMGLLTVAILWSNDMRDIEADKSIITLVGLLGLKNSFYVYLWILLMPYLLLVYYVLEGTFGIVALAGFITLPLANKLAWSAYLGVKGNKRKLAFIDQKSAVLMLTFNSIWIISYLIS